MTEALKQVGNLTVELGQARRMIPTVSPQIPPVRPTIIPPVTVPVSAPVSVPVSSRPLGISSGQTTQPYIPPSILDTGSGPSFTLPEAQSNIAIPATLDIPQADVDHDMSAMWRIPEEAAAERMSAYLEDQRSIAGSSVVATGCSTNEVRTSEWVSEHASVVSSRRPGSAAVSSPPGRSDCGMPEGCGTEGSPVRFKIDLKPKDPPVFAGKGTDDVDVWVKQVSNFLTIIGGPDHI